MTHARDDGGTILPGGGPARGGAGLVLPPDDGERGRRPVLIDTDTGIDDAVALALAARLPAIRVVAVTTVHGNTEVARATRNARLVARRSGLDAPIVAGAAAPLVRAPHPARETHGPEGLGHVIPAEPPADEEDRAAEAIVEGAELHAPLTLCCLGPLTNLARALRAEPSLPARLGPVFVMGGTVRVRGTQTRRSEFNWWSDPESVAAVLDARLDLRLVPLDVTRRIAIGGAAIRALRAAPDDDARFWADALEFYAAFHRGWERFDGCVVNDALAVALVADAALAEWEEMRIGVSCGDDERRGALLPDGAGAPARVALGVRAAEVVSLIGRLVLGGRVPEAMLREGVASAERWLEENPQLGEKPQREEAR
jgi:inosine-uridine nucleoside N-ribohydrolase